MDLFICVKYDGIDSGYSWWIILKEFVAYIFSDVIVGLAIEDVATLL